MSTEYKSVQIEKLKLECSELEYQDDMKLDIYLSASELAEAIPKLHAQLRVIAQETITAAKALVTLTEAESLAIDKKFADGFDAIVAQYDAIGIAKL